MKIIQAIVDTIPENCGECMLMKYVNDRPQCCALPEEKGGKKYYNEIQGNPIDMHYRRHDCPLRKNIR